MKNQNTSINQHNFGHQSVWRHCFILLVTVCWTLFLPCAVDAFSSYPTTIYSISQIDKSYSTRHSPSLLSSSSSSSSSSDMSLRRMRTIELAASKRSLLMKGSKKGIFHHHPLLTSFQATVSTLTFRILHELQALSKIQISLFVTIFILGVLVGKSSSLFLQFRRFKDAVDIPSMYFGPKAPCLHGRVLKVSDGDTLRFYHTPTRFHSSWLNRNTNNQKQDKKKKTKNNDSTKNKKKTTTTKRKAAPKLSDNTLPIRLCSIDTPETPKFGKPGQPYGLEAKKRLEELVYEQRIQVRLLSKDQYGRAVGQVFFTPNYRKFLPFLPPSSKHGCDEILLREGFAEVYTGMGAVYGPKGLTAYLDLQKEAQSAKRGMWSLGGKRESAAEYKKRTKD